MRNLRIAARVLARHELVKQLPSALELYWETGEGEDEIKAMIEGMKELKPFEIMTLIRQIPGIDKQDMTKFPTFKQEVLRAMKSFQVV